MFITSVFLRLKLLKEICYSTKFLSQKTQDNKFRIKIFSVYSQIFIFKKISKSHRNESCLHLISGLHRATTHTSLTFLSKVFVLYKSQQTVFSSAYISLCLLDSRQQMYVICYLHKYPAKFFQGYSSVRIRGGHGCGVPESIPARFCVFFSDPGAESNNFKK